MKESINKKTPELLAPAGSREAAEAAVKAGADAIYLGGTMLNARMNAKNFDDADMRGIIEYCHAHGVLVYVTLNTAVYDRELNEAIEYAGKLYTWGADALIVADIGLARLIREFYPSFPLHASTQASGHSVECAVALKEAGFCRMVCAREMTKAEIDLLCKQSPIEIEQFIHGALCVSQSGQCLASAMIGGRSGNRGACAQPCRMQYNGGYPLSLKDSALAEHIPDIIKSGVASLKIEGRMKSPSYVYGVVSIYRRLLDERRSATSDEMRELAALFSRDGFTDGYYTDCISNKMNGIRTENDKLATLKTTVRQTRVKPGGETERSPIIVPEREMNENAGYTLPKRGGGQKKPQKPIFTARFARTEQIVADEMFSIVYLPLDRFKPGYGANGVVFPPTLFERDRERAEKLLEYARENGAEHALVCNLGHFELAARYGFIIHGDYRLNIFSSETASVYISKGARDVILSPELTLPQIRDIAAPKAAVVYGRIPLMLLTKPVGADKLTDRTGATFPIAREFGYDTMLNSVPFYMADKQKDMDAYGVRGRHMMFTVETQRQCAEIILAFKKGEQPRFPIKRIAK